MSGAVLVAVAAAVGNLLQGWDNATIAGAVLYIKKEFDLESQPTIEGLIVAMSLIGATVITTFSGPVSDSIGRRPMMIISSVLYFLSSLVMLWAPNVYVLLLGRLLDGFGIGLAVTLVPVYISETAPPEIRGLLNTLPQFTGSGGMFLSYCMVFGMSLMDSPSWRLMLGVLSIPSLVYIGLALFFLPESPRWLVSKGRMVEANRVLQRLRGKEDVSGELALLVEGLGVGANTSLEEYVIGPADEEVDKHKLGMSQINGHKPPNQQSWIAKPVTGQSTLSMSRHASLINNQSIPLMDPLVPMFSSIHEKLPETGSMLFPTMGSIFGLAEHPTNQNDLSDVESQRDAADSASDHDAADFNDNLRSPLLSRQATSTDNKEGMGATGSGHSFSVRQGSIILEGGEQLGGSSTDIGGGWQLAWKWSEKGGGNGKKEGGLQRVYLHQDGPAASRLGSMLSVTGSMMPEGGDLVHASALVSRSVIGPEGLFMGQNPVEAVMNRNQETGTKGPSWYDLFEPGVKRALFVGIGIQILQQFSGINGVLYYTPQILEQAGVGVLLSNLGLSSASASLLISGLTTLLMLPCIVVAMRLMDVSGRRSLLLSTIPVLIVSLLILVLGSVINISSVVNATISTTSVIVYFCCFVMGFGPIPNILCSEIFPTRVRGICIAICALTFWTGDIIVTYTLPLMLSSIGLVGVFAIYAVVCTASWFFVFLKVPETKGMPLEVISEFFAVGAKQDAVTTD
ncbi:monosaccharide-sensing protein 2-like [Rhodamnia argentea]|uniref:Monosaccharide-sensing protein 2-like n=1 Tax=Rhodamnia argentea TaxID=178133 RepID=A0A8B8NMQ6_9MYRT|nr:monosaccharide-sensing protein 2-like [Rhodamnia argentea]XP_048128544.1 monosaccharide-sensing protein 2-like [Rhodamnia argentea]